MRHAIKALDLNGTQYGGATGYQLDRGNEWNSEGLDSQIPETSHHLIRRRPMADIRTRSLKTVLSALNDSLFLPQKALDGSSGLRMVMAKAADGEPGFDANANAHTTRTFLRGLIHMAGVSWSPGGKAEMALRAFAKGNGDGLTGAVGEGTVTMPTQPAPDFGFSLTALLLNNQTIKKIDSLGLEIEPNYEHDFLLGLPEPTDIIGAGVRGPLSIRLNAAVGDIDLGSGSAAVQAVFTQYTSGGGFGTNTATFTLNGEFTVEEGIGGPSNGDVMRQLVSRPKWDGTTLGLSWAVG